MIVEGVSSNFWVDNYGEDFSQRKLRGWEATDERHFADQSELGPKVTLSRCPKNVVDTFASIGPFRDKMNMAVTVTVTLRDYLGRL